MTTALPEHIREEASRLKAFYLAGKKAGRFSNQAELADIMGWQSQGTVSQYMTGKLELNIEALLKFAHTLAFDPADVSPRLAAKFIAPSVHPIPTQNKNITPRMLPVIGYVQAGAFCEAVDAFQPGDADEWIEAYGPASSNAFVLKVEGFSMEPDFLPGDKVVVDPAVECRSGDFVVAKRVSDQAVTLKRLRYEGGEPYLFATNPSWPDRIIKLDEEWHLCGRVRRKIVEY